MKKTFTLLIGIVLSIAILNSQEKAPPQAFSYKAIINNNGQPVGGQIVGIRISILQSSSDGASVYSETFQPTTNEFGQIDIEIGNGSPISGTFSDIKWGADKYFLKTDVDADGGEDYQPLSVTQLLSVPYALYAGESKNGFVSQYTDGGIRPVLHNGGSVAIGPDWHEYFKLNVTGPTVLRPVDNTHSSQLWLDGMKSGGNQHVITSEGSYSWVPGGLIIRQNSENWDDFTKTIVMRNNGNVGIGLFNPGAKLGVNGIVNVRPGPDNWWGSTISLDATELEGGKTYIIVSLGDKASEGQGNFLIRDEDWSATILMDPDGKVGIGLGQYGAPQYKLDVAGDINFTGSLRKNGVPFSGDLSLYATKDMQNQNITNLANPVNAQDAATKAYVDNVLKTLGLINDNFEDILSDIDGNIYTTVKIGDQIWMAENLKTTKFKDGSEIPLVTNGNEWITLTTPGYCWSQNSISFKDRFGALYNGYTVKTDNLCPAGWHVPTDAEWTTLTTYLGENYAGGKLKETGTTNWANPNAGATNVTGFTARAAGYRMADHGQFDQAMQGGFWWSSSEYTPAPSLFNMSRIMLWNKPTVTRTQINLKMGLSVRCLKD